MSVTAAIVGTREEGASAGQSVITTAANFQVTADRLSFGAVWVRSDSGAWASPETATLTGGAQTTWSYLTSPNLNTGDDNRIYAFYGVTASPGAAAPLVFTAPALETFKSYAILMWDAAGAKITGTNGIDGIVSANISTASGTGDPLVVTYVQAFARSSNPGISFFMRTGGNVACAPKAGWTELLDDSIGVGGAILSYAMQWKATSDTTAEADYTGSDTGNKLGLALELADASASGAGVAGAVEHGLISRGLVNGGLVN